MPHYSTRRRRAESTIVSRGKTAISAVYPSRFNDERAKSSRIKSCLSQPIRGAWPDRQKLVTQKLDTHPAHREKSLRWTREKKERKKKKKKGRRLPAVSVEGAIASTRGPLEVDRFQYGTRPCLMTRKLVRPTANRDTLAGASSTFNFP